MYLSLGTGIVHRDLQDLTVTLGMLFDTPQCQ
ncbi:hypothetical protein CPL00136_CDS0165 [Salmonella phage vB_SenS-3]